MKFQRFLGALLVYSGGVLVLTSLLASVLPMIDNPQIRLILDSLQTRSRSVVANGLNQALLFVLRNHYPLLGAGAGLMALGGLLGHSARRSPAKASYPVPIAGSSGPYTVLGDKHPVPPPVAPQWRKPSYQLILAEKSPDLLPGKQTAPPAVPFPGSSPTPAAAPHSPGQRKANPYRAYGQRVPSVPVSPAPKPSSPAAYQPPRKPLLWPDRLADRAPADTGTPKEPLPGVNMPKAIPDAGSFSSLPYQRPKPSPRPDLPPTAPEGSGKEAPGAGLRPLPSSLKPGEQKAPVPGERYQDPRYISQRIRSTMKRKSP